MASPSDPPSAHNARLEDFHQPPDAVAVGAIEAATPAPAAAVSPDPVVAPAAPLATPSPAPSGPAFSASVSTLPAAAVIDYGAFDLRHLKSEARRLLPPGHPVRTLLESEPDILPGVGLIERLTMLASFIWAHDGVEVQVGGR